MTATQDLQDQLQKPVDTYLGFEIRQVGDGSFVALPTGWSHRDLVLLDAPNLPAMRKSIWSWWHRFLD